MARSAPSPSRSVITPVTWGIRASASNAVPPLKSASRKTTWSVEWLAHSASTHDTSNSLLPDPVMPATTACGPSSTRSIGTTTPAAAANRAVSGPASPAGCKARRSPSDTIASSSSPRIRAARAARIDAAAAHWRGSNISGATSRREMPSSTIAAVGEVTVMRTVHSGGGGADSSTRASTNVADGWATSPGSSRHITVGASRTCGSCCAHACSAPGPDTTRSRPGSIPRTSCRASARVAAAASIRGPETATPPSSGTTTGASVRRPASARNAASSGASPPPVTR